MTQRIIIRHLGGSKVNQVEQFPVDSFKEILIGRDESAAVRFDPEQDDLVSRLHLKIVEDASSPSGFQLVDLGSRNGTFVKGQRIFGSTPIAHNDVIQLGPGGPEIAFELDPPPAPPVRATREIGSLLNLDAPSRVAPTRIASLEPPATTLGGDPIAPPRPIGRATVERMLDDTFDKVKHESNKSVWIGAVAAALVLIASVVGLLIVRHNSAEASDSARQQQQLLQSVNAAVKQSPQQEAAMRDQIAQLNAEIKKLEDRDAKTSAALNQMVAHQKEEPTPAPAQKPAATAAQNATNGADYTQQVKSALDLLKANQVQPAMQAAAKLISQYPDRWESYGVAGTVLRSQSKLPEAKLAYQRALELAPNEVKPQIQAAIQKIDTQAAAPNTASR